MNYSQFSDEKLIEIFLNDHAQRVLVRDELFGRYYERFDRRIRAVLHSYELPYSAGEFYYNEIFLAVYQQVFTPDALSVILQKYAPQKGNFSGWFLNYVVVNIVKDWLKKKNSARNEKNIAWLKTNIIQEQQSYSLDQPIGQNGEGLSLIDLLPGKEGCLNNEAAQNAVDLAVNNLSSLQRVTLRVMFIAYDNLPENDIAFLADELGVTIPALNERLTRLAQEIRQSTKFAEAEKVELILSCLFQQKETLQKKLIALESELRALFPNEKIPVKEDVSSLQLKDIAQTRQDIALAYKQGRLSESRFHYKSLLLKHQYLAKQLFNTLQKWSKLVQDVNAGKYFISPSYKQLSLLFNIPEGTIASRINRAVNGLKEMLETEEKRTKTRINNVEEQYLRSDGYAP